ncbi:hypothetical protein MML48_1g02844 [Holotrichia oblita]|uniref:Uncharacterized protein n=2 Tax=Holotrichia oblita TaxID=644536 RepID=A0ACB9TTN7_HOLOL|nr:hypothetical protein MML48_1g18695 [Holotrichia oblita]KAI4470139.1 hypothetical protein MML48_1g02844 [Holotrichia oblita]
MAKLDDFLSKKKETAPILDLSKAVVNTKEDFKKLLEKVPDYKIKSEKVRPDDVKIKEKNFKFKTGKKDLKAMKEPYLFMDPVPSEMKSLKIIDLTTVPIDWHMLTTLRPKNKLDEDYFSKIIELGKLEIKTAVRDKRIFAMETQIRRSKNKAGVLEQRVLSCTECGEEFCTGKVCIQIGYDSFGRVPELPTVSQKPVDGGNEGKKKKKLKKKMRSTRSKSRSKKRSKSRSKSPKKDKNKK